MKTLYLDEQAIRGLREAGGGEAVHALTEQLKKLYHPHSMAIVGMDNVKYLQEQTEPGVLFTTMRYRENWGVLPPNITVEIWNGRSVPPRSLPEWALITRGVPVPAAKQIVAKGNFA